MTVFHWMRWSPPRSLRCLVAMGFSPSCALLLCARARPCLDGQDLVEERACGGDRRRRGAVQSVPHSRGHGRSPYPAVRGHFLAACPHVFAAGRDAESSARQRVGRCHDRLGALSYWYYGVFFGLAALVILALAACSQRPVGRATASLALGTLAVIGLPAAYTLQAVSVMPVSPQPGRIRSCTAASGSPAPDPRTPGSGCAVALERVIALQVLVGLCVVAAWWRTACQLACALRLWTDGLLFAAGLSISLPGLPPIPGPFHLFRLSTSPPGCGGRIAPW